MGKWRYGVILDAGSSGTRVYIYRWLDAQRARKEGGEAELNSLPQLHTKNRWTKKVHPGVSTFAETPELVGPEHLQPLVKHALKYIPADQVRDTPVFVLATAGMRLVPERQRNAVLDGVCAFFQQKTQFQLPDCGLHVQVIPGETEGLYGWIAANYLLGTFDHGELHQHGKDHHTFGFLDMGGASAQMAFAPNATEADKHADDLKLLRLRRLDGRPAEYRVFVTTWLGFGANEARRRYVDALLAASPGAAELPDPCLPAGLEVTASGDVVKPGAANEAHLVGTGAFAECVSRTYPLLDKDAPCADAPCLLKGEHVPAIDFDVNHFVGVSEYWHATHDVFDAGHADRAYDFATFQQRVGDFCARDWAAIQRGVARKKWGKDVDEPAAAQVCFKASWLINMLHDGIGVPRLGLEPPPPPPPPGGAHNGTKAVLDGAGDRGFLGPFRAVDSINGVEVSWTLGKMVLYAASQVPAVGDALAVGFGSNVPGAEVPADFQYAGGRPTPLPPAGGGDDRDWHDRLFTSGSSRRLPGLLLLLLILLVAAFLLCGRDRRTSLLSRFRPAKKSGPAGRRRKGFFGSVGDKIFGPAADGPAYERVLEGGVAGPDEFELEEAASDSDSGESPRSSSRHGRTSGWATPKTSGGFSSPALHSSPRSARHGSANPPGYFDGSSAFVASSASLQAATGLPGRGLMARTESREQLAPATLRSGSRSRAPSPSRRSPMITPLRETLE